MDFSQVDIGGYTCLKALDSTSIHSPPVPLYHQLLPSSSSLPLSLRQSLSSQYLNHVSPFNHSSTTMPETRYGDYPYVDRSTSHLDVDTMKMLSDQRSSSGSKRPPDSHFIDSFASAIDDIIKGHSKPKRSRSKSSKTDKTSVFCEQCGATFTSVGNLNRHRRVSHQGIRVACTFKGCKQTFSQTADLTRHRRRVHHQEK